MPMTPNFNNFGFSYEPHKKPQVSEGEERALRIIQLTLQKLVETQTTSKQIMEQINKLKVIHKDEISKDILTQIEILCNKYLPEEK